MLGGTQPHQGPACRNRRLLLHPQGRKRPHHRPDRMRQILPRMRPGPTGLLYGPQDRVLEHEQVHRADRPVQTRRDLPEGGHPSGKERPYHPGRLRAPAPRHELTAGPAADPGGALRPEVHDHRLPVAPRQVVRLHRRAHPGRRHHGQARQQLHPYRTQRRVHAPEKEKIILPLRHHLTGRSYTVPYCALRRYPIARHGRYPFNATRKHRQVPIAGI